MGMLDSDEILATRILREDSQVARTQLYYKHRSMGYAIAGRFFRSPDLVDEAVNIAFWKAFDHLAMWDARRKSFPCWFQSVVKNACRDICRKQKSERDRFRHLKNVRLSYVQPEFFTEGACEFHSERWFNPNVLAFIKGYLGEIGPERVSFITDPMLGRLSPKIRARQTHDRHKIAEQLDLSVEGRELSRRVRNELLLATCCGKLPGGLIQ
jgi:hypothetical protein